MQLPHLLYHKMEWQPMAHQLEDLRLMFKEGKIQGSPSHVYQTNYPYFGGSHDWPASNIAGNGSSICAISL